MAGLLIALALFSICCLGVPLPIWNADARLATRPSDDLGLSLPPGTRILRASRVHTLDPAEFYSVELPPVGASTFHASLGAAAQQRRAREGDPANPGPLQPTPSWWKVTDVPNVRRLDFPTKEGGCSVFYSPTHPRLLIAWFST
jgi:hypothetical protein